MYYTIYKITNTVNNKFYIGMHKTKDLNDGYMGSGKLLKRAIKKYGINNFTKEILFVFDNEQDMINKEKELVEVSEQSYNLCEGGKGGFGFINSNGMNAGKILNNDKLNKMISSLREKRKDEDYNKLYLQKIKKFSINGSLKIKEKYPEGVWKGKKHTEESKQKMKKSRNVGKNNGSYGTFWITNGIDNKKCVDIIPDGWYKGRTI